MTKRRGILISLGLVLLLTLSGCVSIEGYNEFNGYTASEIMADNDILAELVMTSGINASYSFSPLSMGEQQVELKAKRMSGVYTFYEIESPLETTLTMDVSMSAKNLQLVLVDEAGHVTSLAQGKNEKGSMEAMIPSGRSRIALAGDRGKSSLFIENIVLGSTLAKLRAFDVMI